MHTIEQLIELCNRLDIRIWEETGHLRFNAPKGAMTPELRNTLISRKLEIIDFLQRAKLSAPPQRPPIQRLPRTEPLSLSFSQHRLWVIDQIEQGNAAYHICDAVLLGGNLDRNALDCSVESIVQRHEVLRTRFVHQGGNVVQEILPFLHVPIVDIDLSNGSPDNQTADFHALFQKVSQEPFLLTEPPLLRLVLVRMNPMRHAFVVIMHHIITDGWSMGIFIREFSLLYAWRLTHPNPSEPCLALPPLPIQYADYAGWQRQCLTRDALNPHLDYWQTQLKDTPTLLELPTDRPRPAIQTFQGRTVHVEIDPELTTRLKELSKDAGGSLFMTLLGVFGLLLHRYSEQTDVVIGTPIANRSQIAVEPLIGFFVNTLGLRINFSGNPTYIQLLTHVRHICLDAYDHQDAPFEHVIEALQLDRNLSHSPLFQVMFVLQNMPRQTLQLPGLTVTPMNMDITTAKFDLNVSMEEVNGCLHGTWEYNSDLFNPTTITRMIQHFQNLLKTCVMFTNQRIGDSPMMTPAEWSRYITDRNARTIEFTQNLCIHQWFERQVELSPNAIAVVGDDAQWTYQELNQRANQLAHFLRRMNVGPDTLVGICLERSISMIVSVLGVLKAGGAYVPLDPDYPEERLAFMMADAAISVLITEDKLQRNYAGSPLSIICMDRDWAMIAQESAENPLNHTLPDHLIYVIYTSGSTGKPKGTLITHANVVRLFHATEACFHFNQQDVWTLFHSFAFDFSVWEIWGALLYGGRLVIVPYLVSRSPEDFYALLRQQQVTVLNQTPSAFRQLMAVDAQMGANTPRTDDLHKALRLVIFGGEALEPLMLKPWVDRHGDQVPQLVNMYGITETTVHVTFRPIRLADLDTPGSVMGVPIPDLQADVLDPYGQPLPVGIPGELHVSGAGLARGYLNQPELTAQRFISCPLGTHHGARWYRTGDRVCRCPNGELVYLGRVDRQVKIRGFRIELAEIEAVLRMHSPVRDCVAIIREDKPGDRRITAYVVPQANQTLNVDQLREQTKAKLPSYMIPAAFVVMAALPLTHHGKLDERALPKPDGMDRESTNPVPATNSTEAILARIWAEVLGRKSVGIHDNFFELGGDSILSIQAVARANQAGITLSPKLVFQYQTIAELAKVAGVSAYPLTGQDPVLGDVPLTPIQQWFFRQPLPEPHHYNQAALLAVSSKIQVSALQQALAALTVHHDALRFRFHEKNGAWYQQGTAPGTPISFQVIDEGLPTSQELDIYAEHAARLHAGLKLSDGPLLQAALFQSPHASSNRLLVVIHHLVVDGVSWRILLEDLITAYGQLEKGETIQLPAKTTSYQEWSIQLTHYAQSAEAVAESPHWLNIGHRPAPVLPVDFPLIPAVNTVGAADSITVSLEPESTRKLFQEALSHAKAHVNDVLLTVLAQVMTQWTGGSVVWFDLEGHGRDALFPELDLSRTVGWFTSLFPVVLELPPTSSPLQHLKSVKEQLRNIPHQGIGYGILKYLHPDLSERLRVQPPPSLIFNYLGQMDVRWERDPFLGLSDESLGPLQSRLNPRSHQLEINAWVMGGRLHLDWVYGQNIHRRETIQRLAEQYIGSLETLIDECLAPTVSDFAPSDFPLAGLNEDSLDGLAELLGKMDE